MNSRLAALEAQRNKAHKDFYDAVAVARTRRFFPNYAIENLIQAADHFRLADVDQCRGGFQEEVKKLKDEIFYSDRLLKERDRLLDHIPECPAHGKGCIPYAIDWINLAKEAMEEDQSSLPKNLLVNFRSNLDEFTESMGKLRQTMEELMADRGEVDPQAPTISSAEYLTQKGITITGSPHGFPMNDAMVNELRKMEAEMDSDDPFPPHLVAQAARDIHRFVNEGSIYQNILPEEARQGKLIGIDAFTGKIYHEPPPSSDEIDALVIQEMIIRGRHCHRDPDDPDKVIHHGIVVGGGRIVSGLPTEDLNFTHILRDVMTPEESNQYSIEITNLFGEAKGDNRSLKIFAHDMSAIDRCQCFLRAVGKWKEDKVPDTPPVFKEERRKLHTDDVKETYWSEDGKNYLKPEELINQIVIREMKLRDVAIDPHGIDPEIIFVSTPSAKYEDRLRSGLPTTDLNFTSLFYGVMTDEEKAEFGRILRLLAPSRFPDIKKYRFFTSTALFECEIFLRAIGKWKWD